MYLLCKHPQIADRCAEEVCSFDLHKALGREELRKMAYLEAVCLGSLIDCFGFGFLVLDILNVVGCDLRDL